MKTSIIPKYLFEAEDIVALKDKGIKFEEGTTKLGTLKIPSYKFYNLSETEVFDKIPKSMNESIETERTAYANRCSAVMFTKLRQTAQIKDTTQKVIATNAILAATNALAAVDPKTASRFLSLVRAIY